MKKYIKLMCSVSLMVAILLSMVNVVNAKSVQISGNGRYNKYVTCTLRNKRQDATIWVRCWNTVTSANDIKMTTTSGKTIWSERRAISFSGTRQFRLGCDHSAYRIYLKTYVNKGCRVGGTADVYGNNVSVR